MEVLDLGPAGRVSARSSPSILGSSLIFTDGEGKTGV